MRERAVGVMAIVLALTACGGAVRTDSTAPTRWPMTSVAGPTQTAPAAPAATPAPRPTVSSSKLTFNSIERSYRVAAPPNVSSGALIPLMLVLHGYTMDPFSMASTTGFDALAADPGVLVVYPAGYGTKGLDSGWNAGGCCRPANTDAIDDVGFLAALLDRLQADYPVDPDRIFVVGGSNGGEMAYRAACELSDRFAAVVNLIGTLLVDCTPSKPISVLDIHGDADTAIGYYGGGDCQLVDCPSVPDTMERWRQIDGCTDDPRISKDGVVETTTFSTCAGGVEVVFIKAVGKGHSWYASAPDDRAVTWAFLANHPRTAASAGFTLLKRHVTASRGR